MANEKRLIDANRLWTYAWNELQKANKRHVGEPEFKIWASGIAEVIEALAKDMPTVDAVEVVHGRWEQCFEDWRKQIEGDKCSACGFEHYGCSVKHYHYCPNCGANMMDGDMDGA